MDAKCDLLRRFGPRLKKKFKRVVSLRILLAERLVNKTMVMALIVFLAINYMILSENMTIFIDTASIIMVLGGTVSFALCRSGEWLSVSRLSNAAEGAVIAGWLGALYGGIMILSNIDERPLYEWMGSACAVMLLTVVYGYFIKALCRLVVLSRVPD